MGFKIPSKTNGCEIPGLLGSADPISTKLLCSSSCTSHAAYPASYCVPQGLCPAPVFCCELFFPPHLTCCFLYSRTWLSQGAHQVHQ